MRLFLSRSTFFEFLDASSHLYKRVCLSACRSVRPSVCPSVSPSLVIFEGEKYAYEAHLAPCIRPCFLLTSFLLSITSFLPFPSLFSAVFGVFYFLIFILLPSAGGILMSPAISVCFPVFIFIQGPGFEWKTTSCPNEHVFPHDQLSPEDVNRSSRWHMNFNITPDVDWCQMSRNFNKNGCQMSKDAWSQQMSADLVQRTMEQKHLSPGRRSLWQIETDWDICLFLAEALFKRLLKSFIGIETTRRIS